MSLADQIATAIRACAPQADAGGWAEILAPSMQSAGIVSTRRIAMFIGQVAIESERFTCLEEDLTYTHAARLREVWPDMFPVGFDPTPYVGHAELLADYVYGARNGNHAPGDGWLFRGRGLIQITGRTTYTDFAQALGKEPEEIADWVATRPGAAQSACWFWGWAGHGACNRAADQWIITDATRLINPALEAIADRIDACNQALAALASTGPVTSAPAEPSADDLMAAEEKTLGIG